MLKILSPVQGSCIAAKCLEDVVSAQLPLGTAVGAYQRVWCCAYCVHIRSLVCNHPSAGQSVLLIGQIFFCDAWCCSVANSVGSDIPRPPSRVGRESSFRSMSPGTSWPVNVGMNLRRIASSSGLKRSPILGTVLIRNVQRLDRPCLKAA